MSEFTAIRAVSKTLKEILEAHITNSSDPQLKNISINLSTPREMRKEKKTGISIWLYRVARNADLLNRPAERPTPNRMLRRPLPLDLYYLVTPLTDDPESEQALLGRVLQVFNDHSILRGGDLRDTLEGSDEELRLVLEALSLEEITHVWNALNESYQLSVSYMIQLLTIDSDLEPVETSPVISNQKGYKQTLSIE